MRDESGPAGDCARPPIDRSGRLSGGGGPTTTQPSGICFGLLSQGWRRSRVLDTPQIRYTAVVAVKWEYRAITPIIGDLIGPMSVSSTTRQLVERVCIAARGRVHDDHGRQDDVSNGTAGARPAKRCWLPRWRWSPLLTMVGLVVDGGFALANQHRNQNAVDAAANAGAVLLMENLPFGLTGQPQPRTDTAVESAALTTA